MPVTCTPASLADASKCYMNIPARVRKGIRIINFCAIANGTTPSCVVQDNITAAKCFIAGLSDEQLDAIETYLTCQIT